MTLEKLEVGKVYHYLDSRIAKYDLVLSYEVYFQKNEKWHVAEIYNLSTKRFQQFRHFNLEMYREI
jgi:hypothetical protein